MTYIQSLIDNYYRVSNNILTCSLFIIIISLLLTIIDAKEKKISLYSVCEKLFLSIVIIVISKILSQAGLIPHIEYTYFNVLIFLTIIGFLMIYLILLFYKYNKVISIFVNHIKYLQYALYFELFLLTGTNSLDPMEFWNGLLLICLLESIAQIYTDVTHKKESIEADRLPESDWPNLALYPSRELQLKKFIPILQHADSEPYAIMISGSWGGGKTSFVKALAANRAFLNDTFIWIEAGGEKSTSDIMSNISEQIIEVLKTNNIYLENTGIIDRYFQAFSGMLDETNWKFFNKISSVFGTDTKNENTKKYLNRKLAALKSKIYLIVDDLDRCDKEYKEKMFKVIRESTQLTNCKTIFLADRANFLNETLDNNYIEKYISYNLELCPVTYEEIVSYYFCIIFSDAYMSDIQQQILHNRDSAIFWKELLELPVQIVDILTKEIAKLNTQIDSIHEEQRKQQTKLNIQHMQDAVTTIETDTMNSRKVKNFLKGIKADIANLNTAWHDSTINEYMKEDWISKIIRVQFVKHFFPDYYWEIYFCHKIEKYRTIQSKWVKELLLDAFHPSHSSDGRVEDILNLCIYKLDLLDFKKDKTTAQFYLDELRGVSPDISHAKHYIQYATTAEEYSDYQKILALYRDSNIELTLYQKRIFIDDFLCKIPEIHTSNLDAFCRLTENIIDFLKSCSLSVREIYSCGQRGKEIISNCLACNIETLKIPLIVVFGMNFYGMEAENFHPVDFKEFYHLLQHINGTTSDNDTSAHDDIEPVEQYYEQLEKQVQQPAYDELYPYIQSAFEECRLIFKICRLWSDIATTLHPQTSDNAALTKYFSLDSMTYNPNTFQSTKNLKEALDLLEEFYESKERENRYTSDLSQLFVQTVDEILRLCKTNQLWGDLIRTEATEVEARIRRIAEIIYKLTDAETKQSRNIIIQIRVMVFTLERWLSGED